MERMIDSGTVKRIPALDTAKMLAIILMIIGHCHWLKEFSILQRWIYTFHMPVFFIIAGFFIKEMPVKVALVKYSKSYLWPYLVIGISVIVVELISASVHGLGVMPVLQQDIIKVIWGSNCESDVLFGGIPHIGPSWFLLALFWGCLSYTLLQRIPKIERMLWVMIISSFALCSSPVIKLPFSLQGGVICLIYLCVGRYVKQYNLLNRMSDVSIFCWSAGFLLWVLVSVFVSGIDIGSGYLGFSIVGLIVSLVGSAFLLRFSVWLQLKDTWIGKNTLNILCAHILVWRILSVFGWSSIQLSFTPMINLFIEMLYEVILALTLGWLLSKIKILNYRELFK